jgi:hypothetical protein
MWQAWGEKKCTVFVDKRDAKGASARPRHRQDGITKMNLKEIGRAWA